jgi:hypothetical protein
MLLNEKIILIRANVKLIGRKKAIVEGIEFMNDSMLPNVSKSRFI